MAYDSPATVGGSSIDLQYVAAHEGPQGEVGTGSLGRVRLLDI